VLTLRNDEITLKGARNALLPTGRHLWLLRRKGVGGTYNPELQLPAFGTCPTGHTRRLWTALRTLVNNSSPTRASAST
jgi:hypothetical protein